MYTSPIDTQYAYGVGYPSMGRVLLSSDVILDHFFIAAASLTKPAFLVDYWERSGLAVDPRVRG